MLLVLNNWDLEDFLVMSVYNDKTIEIDKAYLSRTTST